MVDTGFDQLTAPPQLLSLLLLSHALEMLTFDYTALPAELKVIKQLTRPFARYKQSSDLRLMHCGCIADVLVVIQARQDNERSVYRSSHDLTMMRRRMKQSIILKLQSVGEVGTRRHHLPPMAISIKPSLSCSAHLIIHSCIAHICKSFSYASLTFLNKTNQSHGLISDGRLSSASCL
jgi:hypothetical protein